MDWYSFEWEYLCLLWTNIFPFVWQNNTVRSSGNGVFYFLKWFQNRKEEICFSWALFLEEQLALHLDKGPIFCYFYVQLFYCPIWTRHIHCCVTISTWYQRFSDSIPCCTSKVAIRILQNSLKAEYHCLQPIRDHPLEIGFVRGCFTRWYNNMPLY